MVTFRCNRSGNTVSFTNDADIAGLRQHEGYTEVKDEIPNGKADEKRQDAEEKEVLIKHRGRPKKK